MTWGKIKWFTSMRRDVMGNDEMGRDVMGWKEDEGGSDRRQPIKRYFGVRYFVHRTSIIDGKRTGPVDVITQENYRMFYPGRRTSTTTSCSTKMTSGRG